MEDNNLHLYLIGDGDDIRHRIELYLLNNDLNALTCFSQNLLNALDTLKESVISTMDAEIIYAGGDDIFFRVLKSRYQKSVIEKMLDNFLQMTGSTFSFGVGENIEDAFLNLRRAKASGKGRLVESGVR